MSTAGSRFPAPRPRCPPASLLLFSTLTLSPRRCSGSGVQVDWLLQEFRTTRESLLLANPNIHHAAAHIQPDESVCILPDICTQVLRAVTWRTCCMPVLIHGTVAGCMPLLILLFRDGLKRSETSLSLLA